jgi:hypothetical protein
VSYPARRAAAKSKHEKARPTVERRHSRGIALLGIVVIVVAVGVIVLIWANIKHKTVVTPSETACDCDDLQLILNRERLAEAAIKSIDSLSKAQSTKNANERYSDDLYKVGKLANQAAVSNASEGDEKTGSAETPPSNCKPDVSKGNGNCMKASLQAHENVHQRECLKYDKRIGDYKTEKTMVEYWQEDREGYQAELTYLVSQRERVVKKCMVSTYSGPPSKDEQQQRLAGSKRRVSKYVGVIS